MQYEGNIIRPPSEAHSIILQVTTGCSHNQCIFCGAYRDKSFRIRGRLERDQDLDFAATYCRRQQTVFLADGNVLVLPHAQLVDIFTAIRHRLPWVRRISLYANTTDINRCSHHQLEQLKTLGLGRIYLGVESGHNGTRTAIRKGSSAEETIRAGRKARQSGIFLSVTCLLGIAGRQNSLVHAEKTAKLLNAMEPHQIAVLTLMVLENTELYTMIQNGSFVMPDKEGLFRELRTLLAGINVKRALFQANHASNYFPLDGRLPRDKEKMLSRIDSALSGALSCKPEHYRAL